MDLPLFFMLSEWSMTKLTLVPLPGSNADWLSCIPLVMPPKPPPPGGGAGGTGGDVVLGGAALAESLPESTPSNAAVLVEPLSSSAGAVSPFVAASKSAVGVLE